MTRLCDNWYLEGRQILHACAPGVRMGWRGETTCECGIVAPRRVQRFYEWMTATAPEHVRRSGLTLVVFEDPPTLERESEPESRRRRGL